MNPGFSEVCASVGKVIDIEGGSHAYLALDEHEYALAFQAGFNMLVGVTEHDALTQPPLKTSTTSKLCPMSESIIGRITANVLITKHMTSFLGSFITGFRRQ